MFTCMVHLDDTPRINGWRLYAVHWNSESLQWATSIQELVPVDANRCSKATNTIGASVAAKPTGDAPKSVIYR
jgi:hypothetical protein